MEEAQRLPGWRRECGRAWRRGRAALQLQKPMCRGLSVRALDLACVPPGPSSPLGAALAHGLPCHRLAEKKASIGYTYEDSTVAEVEKAAEKPEEEESPAEEESNSDEDEVIPDIGGVPSLPSPPRSPWASFCVSSLPLCGTPRAYEPRLSHPCPGALQPPAVLPVSLSCSSAPGLPLSLSFLTSRTVLLRYCPQLGSGSMLFCLCLSSSSLL